MSDAFTISPLGPFMVYDLWRVTFRFVLPTFTGMPLETRVRCIGPFWVGVLAGVALGRQDPDQPFAPAGFKVLTALVVITVVVLVVALNRIRIIRKTGWLSHYAGWYFSGGLGLLVLGLTSGLHHPILVLILLPATASPTRSPAIHSSVPTRTFHRLRGPALS